MWFPLIVIKTISTGVLNDFAGTLLKETLWNYKFTITFIELCNTIDHICLHLII